MKRVELNKRETVHIDDVQERCFMCGVSVFENKYFFVYAGDNLWNAATICGSFFDRWGFDPKPLKELASEFKEVYIADSAKEVFEWMLED